MIVLDEEMLPFNSLMLAFNFNHYVDAAHRVINRETTFQAIRVPTTQLFLGVDFLLKMKIKNFA